MKPLAIVIFSYLAGLLTPAITAQQLSVNLPQTSLNIPNVGSIDPVVIIMGAAVVWAISKARAKRKGGRA
ncbi:MAG: hypothetical protein QJT80_10235 [Candidatus Thiocaldithrix dubininis]|jgi:hypothetical protein|uniref:Uncharacterized protein n=1 Tax=Candidatus Thiocaldithrix dubininis TaxID=3080823 RepID=A0AA95KDX9_9GAMM|nr:MAG: hypothetical protein QJT80_10235 [Candidatus Thiocaldithrix dubininis]